ncbi:MAG TPA: vWA domain-containing protein [Phycisphaerae bacterium]|nr:vWA domain-containing protein [Phycisphaerae bacterium]HRR87125.1 vWA domain-containing protein [Phycisphaerae bacterium]
MAELTFEPLITPTLWLTLAVLATALMVIYASRRPASIKQGRWAVVITLMSTGLLLTLLILLNPTWTNKIEPPAGKPLLTVLVDTSASMATTDANESRTRYDVARVTAQEAARDLRRFFDVRVRTFDSLAAPAEPEELSGRSPGGGMTDLASAITGSLEQDRPQGQAMLLLSDGIHNAPGGVDGVRTAAQFAKAMSAPVYTKTIGGQASVYDLRVEVYSPQQLAYIGQKVPIRAVVKHVGLPGAMAKVSLLHDEKTIDQRETRLMPDGPTDVRFFVSKQKRGLYRYEVKVEPLPGEVVQVNNVASCVLQVVDEPIRVLLLEGKPYWDGKFLMRTLAADPAIAIESIVRLTDGRLLRRMLSRAASQPAAGNATETPAAVTGGNATQPAGGRPESWTILTRAADTLADPEKIKVYQIIVLGRDTERFLDGAAIANLRNWISREGGSLVCYRGAPVAQVDERLERLLPVRWSPTRETRFRMQLTEQGRDLRWLPTVGNLTEGESLPQLPTLATVARPEKPKPMAVVLAAGAAEGGSEPAPVLTYQAYGMGRVVVVEGAGMWRWAFLPPEHQVHDEIYAALWQSLLRWLVSNEHLRPGQDCTLQADKITFSATERASATLLMREEAARGRIPSVELSSTALNRSETFAPIATGDNPGVFRVDFGRLPEGRYEARIQGQKKDQDDQSGRIAFDVRNFAEERLDLQARPDLMARIASDSGGAVIESDAASEIHHGFQTYLARSRPARITRTTAWDRWWVFTAIMLVWGAAWGLRRSGGLV